MTVVRRPAHASAVEVAHGYTGRDVARIASLAVWQARCDFYDTAQQYDIAWSAIAETLWTSAEEPEAQTLYGVGLRAIHDEARFMVRGRGAWQTDKPIKRFHTYWKPVQRQPFEELPVVERIAALQVYRGLPEIHQWTLWALTVEDDLAEAANQLQITCGAFKQRLRRARQAAVELWFAPEPPPAKVPWRAARPRKIGGMCAKGKHEMVGENVGYQRPRIGESQRYCRACSRERKRRERGAAKASALSSKPTA
ncbi:hypothetical protein [Streptomyces sp. NPDC127098]|uniref:hypothetical protein n=1 Tax=Streptomyces sp. NPDC127098 TaxID=3347137 RepID=UPI00364ABFBB